MRKDKRNELGNSKAKQKGDATGKIVAKDLHELNKELSWLLGGLLICRMKVITVLISYSSFED